MHENEKVDYVGRIDKIVAECFVRRDLANIRHAKVYTKFSRFNLRQKINFASASDDRKKIR